MSAIAGAWSFDGFIDTSAACHAMLQELSLYGPDNSAQLSSHPFSMGRRLLRLLPEDRFDHQPLSAGDAISLVADVRLDNRDELADKLKILQQDAAIMADSDILMAAWRRWGQNCVDHLLGAFSFAVWDDQERELFLARDHTGERPLYYSSNGNYFAFASMPKGLLSLPFIGAEVDEDYVARYLALTLIPVEQSIFRRILCLPAGHAMSVRSSKTKLWRYWRTEQLTPLPPRSDKEYLEQFLESFDAAVRCRLRTTGGVGSHLSGGLDSASVAATAARMLSAEGRELTAYTAVPHSDFDGIVDLNHFGNEGPAAAEVATLYPNMRHVLVDCGQTSFLDVLDLNNSLYNHPSFAPSNEVWANAIMTRAQESGITVLLSGKCGNATFSDYGLTGLSAWLRSGNWLTLARVACEIKMARSASFKQLIRNTLWPSLPFWLRSITDPHMRNFSLDYCPLNPEIIHRLDLKRRAFRDFNTEPPGHPLLNIFLKYANMSDSSVAAQAGWRLDFRDPTFDRRVIEFCLAVPLEQFLRGGKLRSLARRAMVGRLPPSTLNRMQRGRQSADWRLIFGAVHGRMLKELNVLEKSPLACRMLDLARMRRLIENGAASGFSGPAIDESCHTMLTLGFSVGKFLRQYDPDARQPV